MKKAVALFMALALAVSLAACSSKQYNDTKVTIPVTDENGETVTDKDGKVVTEISTEADSSTSDEKSSGSNSGSSKTTAAKSSDKGKTTTKKGETTKKSKTTKKGETTKKGDTTKKNDGKKAEKTTESTTAKPEKRDVTVKIILPFYNNQKSKLTVEYKVEGDKDYETFEFEDPADSKKKLEYKEVTLNGKTTVKCELGKLKGAVTVRIKLSGVDVTSNQVVIAADASSGEIRPATGIEVLDGGDL